MGVTKSGHEHMQMDRLWARAVDQPVAGPVRLPMAADGLWTPEAKGKTKNKFSPNQDLLRVANWLLDCALVPPAGGFLFLALERAFFFLDQMRINGHWSLAPNGKTEIFTPSHRQLWLAAMAGILWAARLLKNADLERRIVAVWRVETASWRRCHYVERGELHVLTPGARAGGEDKPMVDNSLCNILAEWLLHPGVEKIEDVVPPLTPRNGSYDAAIPLLKKAKAAGANLAALVGNDSDLRALHPRFGFHVRGEAPGYFYAWFDDLGFVYDGLHGAGRMGGGTILAWTREQAAQGVLMFGDAPLVV